MGAMSALKVGLSGMDSLHAETTNTKNIETRRNLRFTNPPGRNQRLCSGEWFLQLPGLSPGWGWECVGGWRLPGTTSPPLLRKIVYHAAVGQRVVQLDGCLLVAFVSNGVQHTEQGNEIYGAQVLLFGIVRPAAGFDEYSASVPILQQICRDAPVEVFIFARDVAAHKRCDRPAQRSR